MELPFAVDSQLLRELGERLVGRQYIALAELVKNSYDADATNVEILIRDDCIEVSDNGHGMTFEDFQTRWMRVGSTHKVEERTSPELKRALTGSKGVGRLAVQFLASKLELVSVPKMKATGNDLTQEEIRATIDWEEATRAGDLTQAYAVCERTESHDTTFPQGRPHGTKIKLEKLKHQWSPREFEDLAGEIWFLQPPFHWLGNSSNGEDRGFEVIFASADPKAVARFNAQMSGILDLYRSRVVGRLVPKSNLEKDTIKQKVELLLELERGPAQYYEYDIPLAEEASSLVYDVQFEIRVFNLQGRQPYGIPVQMARDYLRRWGGVHIYDAGFRIPYAGAAADWLRLEVDHSHRLHRSDLLPEELNVKTGLNDLPTNSRVLGSVRIDTTNEARTAVQRQLSPGQHLQMQVSRDRLVENGAFLQLRDTVRYALHYYATRRAVIRIEENTAKRGVGSPRSLAENVLDVLDEHEKDMPKSVATKLRLELRKTIESVREQSEWTRRQSGLLGAMATAGATAMALDHQFNQQLNVLEYHVSRLDDEIKSNEEQLGSIVSVSSEIKKWIQEARDTRAIFSPISDDRNRLSVGRFKARSLVENMIGNMRPILRGVKVDTTGIDQDLLLPETSYPVWMAIINNVIMNASNAMLDSDTKQISVSSFKSGIRRGLHIQDTGVGISLENADVLFKPLERELEISSERRALGYGGAGLGLAIVKMLAADLRADVRFVKPETPFNTCFELAWNEGV